jgi:type IV pilus assembly protein PilM
VEDGFVKDINQVSEVIKRAMVEDQILAKEVTFVLNSSRVATKEVILPLVRREKLQELVNANASEYFPVNIDDYVLSYTVLEEKKTKEEQKSRILVFAAPEAMVESYFNLAKLLNMKVKAVDYAGNSTLQLIKIQIDARPTMVVQLGMDTTIVSVMNNNILQLQRTIPYGESLLLNQVMETRNVKANVALELLSSAQIVKESLDKDETTGSLKYLISNVNRVIEYYSSRNQDAPLQKIVIIGEGADVLGMDVLFANETSLPAERLTLLKNVESYNRIKISTSLLKQYMANVGASLDPIHLQPKASTTSTQSSKKAESITPYVGFMAVCVVVAAVLTIYPTVSLAGKRSDKKDLQKKVDSLSYVNELEAKYNEAAANLAGAQSVYLSTCDSTEWTLDLIEYLEECMPSDSYYSGVTVSAGAVTMQGVTMNEYEVAGFLDSLEANDHIINVNTNGYSKSYTTGIVSFNVSYDILSDELLAAMDTADTTSNESSEEAN